MKKSHLMVLAIVAIAVVLAVGAVSAYADITTDAQAPVTTTDAVASYWNSATITATATDNEGVAYIYSKLDGGPARLTIVPSKPASWSVPMPTSKDLPLAAGSHKLRYWAQDVNGNVEARHVVAFTVAGDTAKPVTAATGATDGGWYKTSVSIHLVAADGVGQSGVKELSYALDGAAPTSVTATADVLVPATAGTHTIKYHASDVAGNAEVEKTFTVNVDTSKPVTSATGATDGGWYKTGVSIHLVAADGVGQSGVKELSYALDGAAPTTVAATADVPVPATTGTHTIKYHAGDVAGNAEVEKTFTVNVDTSKPVTSASAASVVKGRKATLKYKVTETGASSGKATVIIRVKNRAAKVVRTIKAGQVAVNVTVSAKFTCTLAKGVYTYTVYATDMVGNAQAKAGAAKLTVR